MSGEVEYVNVEHGRALRWKLHQNGWEWLGLVHVTGNERWRIGRDEAGKVYMALNEGPFGWGPWASIETNSYRRFIDHMEQGCGTASPRVAEPR